MNEVLIHNINVLINSNLYNEHEINESKKYLEDWELKDESLNSIFYYLASDSSNLQKTFFLSVLKNRLLYSDPNSCLSYDCFVDSILNLFNSSNEGCGVDILYNMAVNCLSLLFYYLQMDDSVFEIFTLIPEKHRINFIKGVCFFYRKKQFMIYRMSYDEGKAKMIKIFEYFVYYLLNYDIDLEWLKALPDLCYSIDNFEILEDLLLKAEGVPLDMNSLTIFEELSLALSRKRAETDDQLQFLLNSVFFIHGIISKALCLELTCDQNNIILSIMTSICKFDIKRLYKSDKVISLIKSLLNICKGFQVYDDNLADFIYELSYLCLTSSHLNEYKLMAFEIMHFVFVLINSFLVEYPPEYFTLFFKYISVEEYLTLFNYDVTLGHVYSLCMINPEQIPFDFINHISDIVISSIYMPHNFTLLFIAKIGKYSEDNVINYLNIINNVFRENPDRASYALYSLLLMYSRSSFAEKWIRQCLIFINYRDPMWFNIHYVLSLFLILNEVNDDAMFTDLSKYLNDALTNLFSKNELTIEYHIKDINKLVSRAFEFSYRESIFNLMMDLYSVFSHNFAYLKSINNSVIRAELIEITYLCYKKSIIRSDDDIFSWILSLVDNNMFKPNFIKIMPYLSVKHDTAPILHCIIKLLRTGNSKKRLHTTKAIVQIALEHSHLFFNVFDSNVIYSVFLFNRKAALNIICILINKKVAEVSYILPILFLFLSSLKKNDKLYQFTSQLIEKIQV